MTRATVAILVSFALVSDPARAAGPGLAPDPAAATLHAYGLVDLHPRLVRVDRSGDFATVLTDVAMIVDTPLEDVVLAERFPSGWQLLDGVTSPCSLAPFLPPARAAPLLQGMPLARDSKCDRNVRIHDVGPPADVDAVRVTMRDGIFVPLVRVVGRYALLFWLGGGGGENLYRKRAGTWKRFADFEGVARVSGLIEKGVPAATACELFGHRAGCNRSSS